MTTHKWKSDEDDKHKAFAFSFASPDVNVFKMKGGPMPPNPPCPPFPPGFTVPKIFQFGTGRSNSLVYQNVEDDVLEILIAMPGIEKSSLKVRSKEDKISISAELKEEYQNKLGEKTISHSINLMEDVKPDESKAKYKDGVLSIRIPIKSPGSQTEVEYEE